MARRARLSPESPTSHVIAEIGKPKAHRRDAETLRKTEIGKTEPYRCLIAEIAVIADIARDRKGKPTTEAQTQRAAEDRKGET